MKKRYTVEVIPDERVFNGKHYRITDDKYDARIATSYIDSHADLVVQALNYFNDFSSSDMLDDLCKCREHIKELFHLHHGPVGVHHGDFDAVSAKWKEYQGHAKMIRLNSLIKKLGGHVEDV